MVAHFEVEKKQNTYIMNFERMSPQERRKWFKDATTRVKSMTKKSFETIAEEIERRVPSMNYQRLRAIRAKPVSPTRIVSPYPTECQAVLTIYAESVPGLLSSEEKTFKQKAEEALKERDQIQKRLAEALHRLEMKERENNLLEREVDLSKREIQSLKDQIDRLNN